MADNKEEEHLEKPAIPPTQNPAAEIVSAADADAVNKIQATENMEVHKHPHHITHKKKWREYLLEVLMLFLAVFLGFIAENQREHFVEHQREKKFAGRLLSDLRQDSLFFESRIQLLQKRQNAHKLFME